MSHVTIGKEIASIQQTEYYESYLTLLLASTFSFFVEKPDLKSISLYDTMDSYNKLQKLYQTIDSLSKTPTTEKFAEFGALFSDDCTAYLASMREYE